MASFRETLQRFAVEPNEVERVRLADVLASQLEVRENDLSNRTQVAVWDGQETASQAIDRANEQISNTNVLLSAALEALSGIKRQNDAMLAAVQDGAARLGKLERGQGRLATKMRESQADRADLRRLITELAERVDGLTGDHEQRLTAAEARDAQSREP